MERDEVSNTAEVEETYELEVVLLEVTKDNVPLDEGGEPVRGDYSGKPDCLGLIETRLPDPVNGGNLKIRFRWDWDKGVYVTEQFQVGVARTRNGEERPVLKSYRGKTAVTVARRVAKALGIKGKGYQTDERTPAEGKKAQSFPFDLGGPDEE